MADLIDKKLLLDSLESLIVPEDSMEVFLDLLLYKYNCDSYVLKDAIDIAMKHDYNNGIKDVIKFVKGIKTVKL